MADSSGGYLVGPDREARQRVGTERVAERDVGGVAATRDQHSADPWRVVARIEGMPLPAEEHLEPGSEIHRAVRRWHADVAEVPGATTQTIACAARDAGFDAVLAPAAALPGSEALAVFAHALPHVTAERSEVRQPPPRLADLLPLIRPHEDVPDTVRRLLITLERAGAEAIRRRHR
jgi:hypothetical protein